MCVCVCVCTVQLSPHYQVDNSFFVLLNVCEFVEELHIIFPKPFIVGHSVQRCTEAISLSDQ